MLPNKVREFRKARGWTLEQLAERAGLSVSQISNIEKAKKGWSVDSLRAIAGALDVEVHQLLDFSGIWQEVPVFGVVEAEGIVRPCSGTKAPKVRAPVAFGELLALKIGGDALYPRYVKNEALFCTKAVHDAADCIGKECLVLLENGQNLVRFVYQGATPNHYNLSVHNQPPIMDAAIVGCRPIVYSTR